MIWKIYVLQLRNPLTQSCPRSRPGFARLIDLCAWGSILPASHLSIVGFTPFLGLQGLPQALKSQELWLTILGVLAHCYLVFGFFLGFMANAFLCWRCGNVAGAMCVRCECLSL